MIDCAAMQDRMPDVALGAGAWTDAEAGHLLTCADCALEWRIVRAGAGLHADTIVPADRIATLVMTRLREAPPEPRAIRRIPWRGTLVGLIAAAASVILVLGAPRLRTSGSTGISDSATLAVLPELQGLDDGQLETVLKGLDSGPIDAVVPGQMPHLEDLTDAQLEQLLHTAWDQNEGPAAFRAHLGGDSASGDSGVGTTWVKAAAASVAPGASGAHRAVATDSSAPHEPGPQSPRLDAGAIPEISGHRREARAAASAG